MELTEIERSAINLMLENSGDERRVDDLSSAEVEGFILDIRRREQAVEAASFEALKQLNSRHTSGRVLNSRYFVFTLVVLSVGFAVILLIVKAVGLFLK